MEALYKGNMDFQNTLHNTNTLINIKMVSVVLYTAFRIKKKVNCNFLLTHLITNSRWEYIIQQFRLIIECEKETIYDDILRTSSYLRSV